MNKNVPYVTRKSPGFTLVELAVVIVVIGILGSVGYFGFQGWRDRVAETELKNDLSAVAAAMESAKNWSNGYPSIPVDATFDGVTASTKDIFTQSKGVRLTYYAGTDKSFCIDAVSLARPNISMFIDSASGSSSPVRGTCAGGPDASPTPTGSEWMQFVYDMNQPGCDLTVQLPITSPSSSAGSLIDWGDGSTEARTSSLQAHTYASKKRYVVSYRGSATTISHSSVATANRGCLIEMRQWGTSATPTTVNFSRATNLVKVPDTLPASVTNLSNAFSYTDKFEQNISGWNTSNVTNMSYMFYYANAFNQPIGSWDTSKVTNMYAMFYRAIAFNQPIGAWNTGNVTNMSSMFFDAPAFNQDISGWDTSKVFGMNSMFTNATAFNRDLSSWNVAAVTTRPPTGFDSGASAWTLPRPVW